MRQRVLDIAMKAVAGVLFIIPSQYKEVKMKRNVIVAIVITLVLAIIMFTACAKADFELSSLEITPNTVGTGDTASVKVDVTNLGKAEGTYTATLTIDGALVETTDVIVAPETTKTVTFAVAKEVIGDYAAEVGGLTETLRVVKPAEFVVSNLQVVPAPDLGEDYYRITVDIENVGALQGIYQLRGKVNDEEMEPVKMELAASERKTATLIGTESTIHGLASNYKDEEIDQREHVVSIEGLSESITFAARPPPKSTYAPPPTPAYALPPKPVVKLQLLNYAGWTEGGTLVYSQGEVKNNSDESLADVEVVIRLYNYERKFITSGSALIDKNPLLPGQTSGFLVSADNGGAVQGSYSLYFRFLSGNTILHERIN